MREIGRPPEHGEAPDAARREGEALVEVLAVPLNPIDVNVVGVGTASFSRVRARAARATGAEGAIR